MGMYISTPPSRFPTQAPNGKMYLTANQQNLVHGGYRKILLNAIHADFVDAIENTLNNRITPGVAGFYYVGASITWESCPVNFSYKMAVLKYPGADAVVFGSNVSVREAGVEGQFCICSSDIVYFALNDYVELHANNGSLTDTADVLAYATHLTVQRVR